MAKKILVVFLSSLLFLLLGFAGGVSASRVTLGLTLNPFSSLGIADYRRNSERLGRNIEADRRNSIALRNAVTGAIDSVDASAGRLETSVSLALKLKTVPDQLRGISTAIKGHGSTLRTSVEALRSALNSLPVAGFDYLEGED